jgi:hypothetical protein
MQVDLSEQEITKLIQLVTADMLLELRAQPPEDALKDFKASLADLAQKLHDARNTEMKTRLKNN